MSMQTVQKGDTVKVHYHGKLTTGETFDSSEGREPLQFTVGNGDVIPGFDQGVMGMAKGDKKTVQIPVQEAYGERSEQMIFEIPKTQFPPDITPEEGMQLMMSNGQGQSLPVSIVKIGDENVTLDGNHPLAGQDLIFDIELVDVNTPSRIIMP